MAMNIPYPGMDFVPLDVLTAAEQDQLVANIEYISNQFPLGALFLGNGAVITSKINDGAVTNAKLDWSSIVDIVGTYTGSGDLNYCIKYGDGTMIAVIKKTVTLSPNSQWGSLYQTSYNGNNLVFAVDFTAAPAISISTESAQTLLVGYEGASTKSHTQTLTLARPQSASNVSTTIHVTAIGRWK